MFVKTFAVLAVLSGTALPIVVLSVYAVMEAQIPHCSLDLPSSEPICTDAVTGLKFHHHLSSGATAAKRPIQPTI